MATGVITTLAVFDFETVQEFSDLLLVIFDDGGLNSNVSFRVAVVDSNDNSPIFSSSSTTISISEGTSVNSEVYVASATDADATSNGLITYSFGNSSVTDFAINSASGAVSVRMPLDFETTTSYILEIIASDNGMPSRNSSFSLTVNILDDNDNAPVIMDLPLVNLTENVSPGTIVGTIVATDADSGTNAEIIYEIVAGNEAGDFAINRLSGIVFTTGAIDREEIASYSLTIQVEFAHNSMRTNNLSIMSDIILYSLL